MPLSDPARPAAPAGVEPVGRCPLFGRCGGCTRLDLPDAQYAERKRALVVDALRARSIEAPIAPLLRLPFASRRRATFTARAPGGPKRRGTRPPGATPERMGYFAARSHDVVDVKHCPALAPPLEKALPAIRRIALALARERGEVRALATLCANGIALDVSTIKRSRQALSPMIEPDPNLVRVTLDGDILLQAEEPVVRFDGLAVAVPPDAFLQPSLEGERALTTAVLNGVGEAERVADAFAGLGTFAIPLTRSARVTAIDVAGASLAVLAGALARAPGRRPLSTVRRNLMSDPLSPAELAAFDAVVFDPPRAGAEGLARSLAASAVPCIVAVSCEPRTLARDLSILLAGGYKITHVVPVDQFVGTDHIEAVATLRRG